MKNWFHALALLLALCLLPQGSSAADEGQSRDLDIAKAEKLVKENADGLIIVDVRTPAEFNDGHLANARNIDFFGPKFDLEIADLPKDKPILLYCRSGRRSEAAAEALEKSGHTKVLHMKDGLEGWKKAGLPVKK